jgi:flagellar protein FliL
MAGEKKFSFATIFMFLLVIIIAAGTSFAFMTFFNTRANIEAEREMNKIGPTYSLGDFVVNLSGSGGYQYIKASIVVEVNDKKVVSELDRRSPQIRDVIIAILRDQKIQDIEEPGAEIIKNQIELELNQILNIGEITAVWFTQLVVQ